MILAQTFTQILTSRKKNLQIYSHIIPPWKSWMIQGGPRFTMSLLSDIGTYVSSNLRRTAWIELQHKWSTSCYWYPLSSDNYHNKLYDHQISTLGLNNMIMMFTITITGPGTALGIEV